MCNRDLIEILLDERNFLSVVGVFGYNPGLKRETDFRSALEGEGGFNEVIPITDRSVVERVHTNFRIQVIKDNVLSRSLPDGCMLLLEYMANENNFYILSYISETEEYWKAVKELVASHDKRQDGLGLLKAIINLTRVTKRLDRPQRREPFGALPVFSSLIDTLFGDGKLFAAFVAILGSSDSKAEEVASVVDILNVLVFYLGPDRLRAYLASEGKCVPVPAFDDERIAWTSESSLFTALLVVFERDEPLRIQLFNLLREVFRVPQGQVGANKSAFIACVVIDICELFLQDDKFLSVLYPNYMRWLLQPLKSNLYAENESAMFKLHDSIMELLTFCTENHGYRVKYLFGRQPVASYADKMLRSKNRLFVIRT
uniref:Serine/threonine-protein phosphatase 4 regulatory subunit 3-like central domain-containing protein n=1 Tax=Hyaloperonospora arabidopsidis (strain Emoy2) TaxID=559515 RepID=M4BLY6_HYAAE